MVYEGDERFEQVARILRQKYGVALLDLVPSPDSTMWLYGDHVICKSNVEKFRHAFFGVEVEG